MSIRPPDDHLELGAYVRWHHRAGVARKLEQKRPDMFASDGWWSPWILTREAGGSDADRYGLGNAVSPLKGMALTDSSINKTVVCWPEEGGGIVIGLVRKGIGVSVRGYESGYYETPEWNPGYFNAREWIWLYAVKGWISGTNYYYVPTWAVTIDEGRNT